MHAFPLPRLIAIAALSAVLPGSQVMALAPAPELTVGFSSFHLRPASGSDQRLNGIVLGARYALDAAWSVEGALNRQTGAEAGEVELRQLGFLAGPRYSWAWSDQWQGFAHFQVGAQQLHASDGFATDTKSTLAFGPGVGAEFKLNRKVSFRVVEDYVVTRYAGVAQRNTSFTFGLALRR
jgi:hypothetical protein